MRHARLAALITLAAVALPAAAAGAATPGATTTPATNIAPQGATLNGTVSPNGRSTKAYFQYGKSAAYGTSTPRQAVGAGTTPVSVSASVTGLRSSTTYHYRVVAVNGSGTRSGADRTFRTAAPTTTPTFSPNPAVFGRPFTVSGKLVGSGSGHAQVTLLARPFPFTAPFAKVGNTVISNADGSYAFTIAAALGTAQFQVKASTNPPVTSPVVTLPVSSLITMHVRAHVRYGTLARFAGSVAPPQDGLVVQLQKRTRSGSFRSVAHTALRHSSAARSVYSRRLRLRRSGTYRTVVLSSGGQVSPGASLGKSIRVER